METLNVIIGLMFWSWLFWMGMSIITLHRRVAELENVNLRKLRDWHRKHGEDYTLLKIEKGAVALIHDDQLDQYRIFDRMRYQHSKMHLPLVILNADGSIRKDAIGLFEEA